MKIFIMAFILSLGGIANSAVVFDDFNTDNLNWTSGGGVNAVWVSGGGPFGAGDAYVINDATAGAHQVMNNLVQWSAIKFQSVGVTELQFYARTADLNPVRIRLAMRGSGGDICTTKFAALANDNQWHLLTLSAGFADFSPIAGASVFLTLEDNSKTVRLNNSDLVGFTPQLSSVVIDYDKITYITGPTSTFTSTPAPLPSATRTATRTPSASLTPSPSPSATQTATASPSITPTGTMTGTATPSASPSDSPTVTLSASPSPTQTASATGSATATASATFSASPTATASFSSSASPTETLTASETVTLSDSPTWTLSMTATPSASPSPSESATRTVSATQTPTVTVTMSCTPSGSPTASPSFSASPTWSETATATPTASISVTSTETASASPTPTETETYSYSPTAVDSFTATPTATPSPSPSITPPGAFFGGSKLAVGPVPLRAGQNWCFGGMDGVSTISWLLYDSAGELAAEGQLSPADAACAPSPRLANGMYFLRLIKKGNSRTEIKLQKLVFVNY